MSNKTSIIIAIIAILLGAGFVIYDKTSKTNQINNPVSQDVSVVEEQKQKNEQKTLKKVIVSRDDAVKETRDMSRQSALGQLATAILMYGNDQGGKIPGNYACVSEEFFKDGLGHYIYKLPREMNSSLEHYGCKGEYYFRKVDSKMALVAATMEVENGNYCGDTETLKNADIETIKTKIDGCENGQGFVELIEYGR